MFILETFSSVFEYKTFLVKIALLVKGRFPVTRFSCTCTRIVKYKKAQNEHLKLVKIRMFLSDLPKLLRYSGQLRRLTSAFQID